MKLLICAATAACLVAIPAWAHGDDAHPAATGTAQTAPAPALDAHTMQDVERHRSMALAHTKAAQCLAQGKAYDACQKQLQVDCKGLALGKNCGMRHAH